MELVTLRDWIYPESGLAFGEPVYVPKDAPGRHTNHYFNKPTPRQPSVYQPEHLVENYNSLIWKEGFRASGSFELKTYDVEATLKLLPRRTLVSLRDSTEVCIVTTHHIETNEEGQDVLTVSGISLMRFLLENRPTWAYWLDLNRPDRVHAERVNIVFQIPDHISFILWSGLVFPHSEGGYPQTGKSFELPFNIMIPNSAISQSIFEKGDYYRAEWPPPIESRLTTINEVVSLDQRYGLRTIRPSNRTAYVYTPTLTSLRGEGGVEERTKIQEMLFDVYQGYDRSEGADRVLFRHDAGDIVNSEYLSSVELYKNAVSSHAEVEGDGYGNLYPKVLSHIVWESDAKVDKETGLPVMSPYEMDNRKYIAGTEFAMGEVASTAKVQGAPIPDTQPSPARARMYSEGLKYLQENEDLNMLTADISPHTQYKYGQHYELGDAVLIQGKYGSVQKMVVSEYTRTSEESEISGYPTLVRWKDPADAI